MNSSTNLIRGKDALAAKSFTRDQCPETNRILIPDFEGRRFFLARPLRIHFKTFNFACISARNLSAAASGLSLL
jgi:hypothetical protein